MESTEDLVRLYVEATGDTKTFRGTMWEQFAVLRGNCPSCKAALVHGEYLKWCPNRACGKVIGPK